MLDIPSEVKQLYLTDGIYKNMRIVFLNVTHPDICNDKIVQNSCSFKESVCSQDNIKLGLYEVPTFECQIATTENLQGYQIEVLNEIDCTSLGSEFCDSNATYRTDLGIYVYPVQIGIYTISSCKLENDKLSKISAIGSYKKIYGQEAFFQSIMNFSFYGHVLNGTSLGSEDAASLSKLTYEDLYGLNVRTSKGRWSSGTAQSLSTQTYTYSIASGLSLKWTYERFVADPDIRFSQEYTADGSSTGTGTWNKPLKRYNAVIDYDKDKRNSDIEELIDSSQEVLPESLRDKFSTFVGGEVMDYLKNPYYSLNGSVCGYVTSYNYAAQWYGTWSYPNSSCMLFDKLKCDGNDYYIYNFNCKTRKTYYSVTSTSASGTSSTTYYYLYSGWVSRKGLNAKKMLADDRALIIPKKLEVIYSGNIIASCDFSYSKKEVRKISVSSPELSLEPTTVLDNQSVVIQYPFSKATVKYCVRKYKNTYSDKIETTTKAYDELAGNFMRYSRQGGYEVLTNLSAEELFPALLLYPSDTLYPRVFEGESFNAYAYSSLSYEQTGYNKYGRVSCTYTNLSGNSASASVDMVDNYDENVSYYIEYSLSDNEIIKNGKYSPAQITTILERVANSLKQVTYIPIDVTMMGIPWVEAGDVIKIITPSGNSFTTIVLSRTITGEQHLSDNLVSQ